MRKYFYCSSKGFTLIEILVVVAIISLLAAILFPVFARARENARRASCLSNLKQLSLAITMYTQDYDEFYPIGYKYGATDVGGAYWDRDILPYIKNSQIFECPGADDTSGIDVTVRTSFENNVRYGMNLDSFGIDAVCASAANDASIVRPAELLMLIDTAQYPNDDNSQPAVSGWEPFEVERTSVNTAARHFGGADIAFADGHVKWETMYFYHPRPGESADSLRMQQLWEKQYQH
jgi:prepilin-type N-terminal cleavage/methylation domain-containing protein/prepilin-type processing-associated H-X9-DG protein